MPILFDFNVPATRDITETVSLLARMARFIIADLTDPSSIPKELEAIVPGLAVPVQPLLEGSSRPYAMFKDYWKYDWELPVYRYEAIEPLPIPFNGSAPTVQGLLTGAVDYIIDGAATSLPLIHSGKLRALAKLNSRPLPALPEVRPLAVEAGIPALDDISTWIGLVTACRHPTHGHRQDSA